MPTPMMPKRTRSLGAAAESDAASNRSSPRTTVLAVAIAPATPALLTMNARLEYWLLLMAPSSPQATERYHASPRMPRRRSAEPESQRLRSPG